MKEFVLVEFLAEGDDRPILMDKLLCLGDEFKYIQSSAEYERDSELLGDKEYTRVSGRISSEYASIIKLQDAFLADRMRVSYIPEDLKDKYRT